MTLHFITFGDGINDSPIPSENRRAAADRLASQALETGWFDSSEGFNLNSLKLINPEWFDLHRKFITTNARGCGYWIWKSLLITEKLRSIEYGDILVYADAGHEISPAGSNRFDEYIKLTNQFELLAFDINEPISKWTKGDLLNHFSISNNDPFTSLNQVQAGLLFIKKTTGNIILFNYWNSLSTEYAYKFINDSPSRSQNSIAFIEHRHDQSIFTLLIRLSRRGLVLKDESFTPTLFEKNTYDSSIPFQCLRNPTGIRLINNRNTF